MTPEVEFGQVNPITLDRLLAETGHDYDLLSFVLNAYESRSPQLLAGLQQAAACDDRREAAQHAHDLASTSGQVGALGISKLAREIENLAEHGDGPLTERSDQIALALSAALVQIQGIAARYESSRR